MILAGTNNYVVTSSAGGLEQWALGITTDPVDVANGVRAIAQIFRRRLPQTRVIMLGILPVSDVTKWGKCQQTNAVNAKLSYDKNEVVYLDLQNKYLNANGTLNGTLFSDGAHLTSAGYRLWATSMDSLVKAYMAAAPLQPFSIMPIGGSVTEGFNSDESYRRYLDGMLRRAGHQIDFVGGRNNHNNNQDVPQSYEFDINHEGRWGKATIWMADSIGRLTRQNVPNIVLVNMGTEDLLTGTGSLDAITGNLRRFHQL